VSVDHRPLLERKARGVLVRAYLAIVGCAVLGGGLAASLVLIITQPSKETPC